MFDPSKLELNLDEPETKKPEVNKETKTNLSSDKGEIQEDNLPIRQSEDIQVTQQSTPDILDITKEGNQTESSQATITDSQQGEDAAIEQESNTQKDETSNNIITEVQTQAEQKTIFNININSLQDLLILLIEKEYDFLTIEPETEKVRITFKKDKVEKETHAISYPIYSRILLKIKSVAHLSTEETNEVQEGAGETILKNKNYKIISKIVPSELGEKIFLKAKLLETKVKKEKKKTSFGQILGFLSAIAFISLVLGGAFTGFVVMNAKTVEDVKFFYSLGINLNDINNFISQLITIIFSILLFIETVFLVVYLFKFSLTRKEFKQKKIRYAILGVFFLILTFSTASGWMLIDKKVKSLPNWQEMAYGDVQVYDNAKLISDAFDKGGALLNDTTSIIGPIDIKFDLSFFTQKETQKGMQIKKFIWDFGGKDLVETPNDTVIKTFDKKGNYEVSLIIEEVDPKGNVVEKKVENIPSINVSYIVEKEETKLTNGGKLVSFDANSLKELGKIEWYFLDSLEQPIWQGYTFTVGKAIFEETLIGMYIRRNDKTDEVLDKIFVIASEEKNNLDGEITYTRSVLNDLEFNLQVENIDNGFGDGFVEEFKWIIGEKEITKKGNIDDLAGSSQITYTFESYGEQEVKVILKNSSGETKEISALVDVPQTLSLSSNLRIYNNNERIEEVKYEEKLGEYYIDEIDIPTQIKLDSRFVRANDLLYTLKDVAWDFNGDGDTDSTSKLTTYDINTPGNHTIEVTYTFAHRKIPEDTITLTEKIFIEAITKEAILYLDIEQPSSYAPVTIKFDASKSKIKDENIVKFIWDYGDGITEERDAVIPGHKYLSPGDYDVKVTIVTESGKEYSTSKKVILKPKPQSVKITASMKQTFTQQGIDFSSADSEGTISSYFWDFGDGNTSTQANPTHAYKQAGNYTVTLRADFSNNNVLEDKMNIEIVEE